MIIRGQGHSGLNMVHVSDTPIRKGTSTHQIWHYYLK